MNQMELDMPAAWVRRLDGAHPITPMIHPIAPRRSFRAPRDITAFGEPDFHTVASTCASTRRDGAMLVRLTPFRSAGRGPAATWGATPPTAVAFYRSDTSSDKSG
jgi:hypothetical protein